MSLLVKRYKRVEHLVAAVPRRAGEDHALQIGWHGREVLAEGGETPVHFFDGRALSKINRRIEHDRAQQLLLR